MRAQVVPPAQTLGNQAEARPGWPWTPGRLLYTCPGDARTARILSGGASLPQRSLPPMTAGGVIQGLGRGWLTRQDLHPLG